jgi:hypothetical protein
MFGVHGDDLLGWVGVVVQQSGQDPKPAPALASSLIGDVKVELDQPGGPVGQAADSDTEAPDGTVE